jgi:DNA-nicking Smr family endonuclease
MAKTKGLSRADLQLWAAYSQTLKLLPGKTRLPVLEDAPPAAIAQPPAPMLKRPAAGAAPKININAPPPGLDRASWQTFRAGKTRAARTLDLHGLTAAHAHRAATNFILRAYGEHLRCVEIITGKGEVLARELPLWLNAPELRPFILALAHPHAANTGSLRVLLRRIR